MLTSPWAQKFALAPPARLPHSRDARSSLCSVGMCERKHLPCCSPTHRPTTPYTHSGTACSSCAALASAPSRQHMPWRAPLDTISTTSCSSSSAVASTAAASAAVASPPLLFSPRLYTQVPPNRGNAGDAAPPCSPYPNAPCRPRQQPTKQLRFCCRSLAAGRRSFTAGRRSLCSRLTLPCRQIAAALFTALPAPPRRLLS